MRCASPCNMAVFSWANVLMMSDMSISGSPILMIFLWFEGVIHMLQAAKI